MRRALLFVLAVAVIAVAGWSAAMAAATTAPVVERVAGGGVESCATSAQVGMLVVDEVAAPVVRAAGPVARLRLERGRALALVAFVLAVVIGALSPSSASRSRRGIGGAPPLSAPLLRVAPRRGPPPGLARPFGT